MANNASLRVVIEGDNHSVTRVMREVATESRKTGDQISSDGKRASSSFDEMGKSAHRLRGAIGGALGMVGFGGLAFGIKDVIQGGLALQASQTQVGNSLAAMGLKGKAAASALAAINAESERMSTHGGGSTEQMNSGMARLIGVTHNLTQAQTAQRAAVALSVKTGQDYETSLNLILSAEGGRVRGLQKYIGIVTPATAASQSLVYANKERVIQLTAESKLYGKLGPLWLKQQEAQLGTTKAQTAAASAADKQATAQQVIARVLAFSRGAHESLNQKVQDTRHAFQNLTNSMGTTFLPVIRRVIGATATSVEWLGKHKVILYGLLGAVAAVSGVLAANAAISSVVEAKGVLLRASNMALGTSFGVVTAGEEGAAAGAGLLSVAMDAIPIFAIIGGVVLLATHFRQVKQVAVDVFHGIVSGARALWHGIEAIGSGIFHALTWAFKKASDFIMHDTPFGGLLGFGKNLAGGHVGSAFGSLLHGISFGLLHGGGVVKPHYFGFGGPVGTDTIPGWLTPGEGVVTTQGMANIGGAAGLQAINSGGGGGGTQEVTIRVPLIVDGRKLAEAVTRAVLNRAARGPTSLVGGSLVTGAPGLAP